MKNSNFDSDNIIFLLYRILREDFYRILREDFFYRSRSGYRHSASNDSKFMNFYLLMPTYNMTKKDFYDQ